ncbi:hypothetical protein Holit_03401 [Hollandina sp. SP2]
MLLSILIPTYNRVHDLSYNLQLVEEIIIKKSLQDKISIIISNNNSSDATDEMLKDYLKISKLHILYFNQQENIGLEKNSLFCLSKSNSDYVMFLSDDDYLSEEYIYAVINTILENRNISCIVPSFVPILPDKAQLSTGKNSSVLILFGIVCML